MSTGLLFPFKRLNSSLVIKERKLASEPGLIALDLRNTVFITVVKPRGLI